MFIIIVFRLGSDVSCFFYCFSQRILSPDVTPRLGKGGWFFIAIIQVHFVFCWLNFIMFFSISCTVLTCYVYYCCIWLGFNTLFSCFFAGFQLFSPKESVTGCDSSLWSFCYSKVTSFLLCILHSGCYYCNYVVIGGLRPLRLISWTHKIIIIKYWQIMFIIIAFWLGCDMPSGLLFFVPALLSVLTPFFVCLSYFVLAVPMRECLGKHSCMSSPFPIAILNDTCFFSDSTTTTVQCVFGAKNKK